MEIINKTITYFLDPYFWIFIFLAYLILKLSRTLFSPLRSIFLIFLILFISSPTSSNLLVNNLENKHNPIDLNSINKNYDYNIIVLGGGFGYDSRHQATSLLSTNTLGRLIEGIRVLNHLPKSTLITSGTSKDHILDKSPPSQAELMKQAATLLGVKEDKIRTLSTPWNTQTEAKTYIEKFGKEKRIILVTCAYHMPRAFSWFKYYGAKNIIPAPTNFSIRKDEPQTLVSLLPQSHSLATWQKGLKEIIGKLQIYFMGLFGNRPLRLS